MPIRRELRHFYRGPAWKATRARILERAGNKCERCAKPNRALVWVLRDGTGRWAERWEGSFRSLTLGNWRDQRGAQCDAPAFVSHPDRCWPSLIRCVLTIAHLNQIAGDDRDDNLAALCQRCHLAHDARQHVASARRTVAAQRGQLWLSPEIEAGGITQSVGGADGR